MAAADTTMQGAVREAARANDLDRYLSALLAPQTVRGDLLTLAAFGGVIARVPLTVSEPMIGEIRLQWWWDVIERAGADGASGHPVADAVVDLVRRGRADKASLQAVVDAYRDTLTSEPAKNDRALAQRIDATEGGQFRLAAGVVAAARGGSVSQDARAALYAAAQGYGMARLLCTLPVLMARGLPPLAGLPAAAPGGDVVKRSGPVPEPLQRMAALARDALATARGVFSGLDAGERAVVGPALLPAALIEPYLRAFETAAKDTGGWVGEPADILPLRRAWALAKARYTGRL